MRRLLLAACLALFGPASLPAAAPWTFSGPANAPEAAIGKLQVGRAQGSATVVGPRRSDGEWDVASVAHCASSQSGTLTLRDGTRLKVRLVRKDASPQVDTAWFRTEGAPPELPHVLLAEKAPGKGEAVFQAGYGRGLDGEKREGAVVGHDGNTLALKLFTRGGDSGGGVIHAGTGELVGAMSRIAGHPAAGSERSFAASCEALARIRPPDLPPVRPRPDGTDPWSL